MMPIIVATVEIWQRYGYFKEKAHVAHTSLYPVNRSEQNTTCWTNTAILEPVLSSTYQLHVETTKLKLVMSCK
jgi:hypothetical protein